MVSYDRPYLIGPNILEPISKIIIVTDKGCRYEANICPKPVQTGSRILTDEEASRIDGVCRGNPLLEKPVPLTGKETKGATKDSKSLR